MITSPIAQARANGIKINQPNAKENLQYVLKKISMHKSVLEENQKAACCQTQDFMIRDLSCIQKVGAL